MDERFPSYLFADETTGQLNLTAKNFLAVQKLRKGMELREGAFPRNAADKRGNEASFALLGVWAAEDATQAALEKLLKTHILWSGFLENHRGLAGALTARVLGEMRHPGRFPGQRCTAGHYLPTMFSVGDSCPTELYEEAVKDEETGVWLPAKRRPCDGTMLEPRARIDPRTGKPETGVRSLFHFAGLIADTDGRAHGYQSLAEGQRRDWDAKLKTLIMQPKGVAEQIVNHKPEPYYSEHPDRSYVQALRRLAVRDGVDPDAKAKNGSGTPDAIRIKRLARKIAAKLWLGDVLMEWKRRTAGLAS